MMNWKKYIIYSISTLCILALAKYAISCIPEAVYYDYPSFFGNKATDKTAYRPFFYVDNDLYYNNRYDKNQADDEQVNTANIKEWQAYAGPAIAPDDIDSVMNTFTLHDVAGLANGGVTKLPPAKSKNSFAKWLTDGKAGGALDYLLYAKQCEPFVVATNWDTLTVNKDSSELLITKGLDKYAKAADGFLRMRYAFQVLRLAFYNQQNDRTVQLFDKLFGSKQDSSLVYARCLGFKAGAYFRKSYYAQAAYLYSKVFEAADGLKRSAMVSFLWCVHNNESPQDVLKAALELCKNNHECAVIIIMQALREYKAGLPLIQKAYALDPTVEGIDVLVNREINKVEERYQAHYINKENGIEYDSYSQYFEDLPEEQQQRLNDSLRSTYPAYLNKLNDFARRMVADKKNGHTAYWYLTSAYINYMLRNTKQMQAAILQAETAGMNNSEKQLYNVMLILYAIKNQPAITPALEATLLPQLQALDKLADESSDQDNNFYNMMNYLLAPKYLQQKDTAKALYCMAHSQRQDDTYAYGNDANWRYYDVQMDSKYFADPSYEDRPGAILDRMSIDRLHGVQAFLSNENKTPFEAWLTSGTHYTTEVLAELEGTKYMREYNFKAAEKVLAAVPNPAKLANPFEMFVNDYENNVSVNDKNAITKYSFAKQMATLQDTIAKNPNNAPALYKYALGLYGMSYYGQAAHLFTYSHHPVDEFKYFKTKDRDKLPKPFQEYYGVYTAEKYFNLAEKAAANPTLKAKCIFGGAKCWQKRCPDKNDNSDYELSYVAYSLTNPYFKTLKSKYGNDEFTKEVYNTCSYYKDYVKRGK